MPLVPCRACGHQVDTSALACPRCGATDPAKKISRQRRELRNFVIQTIFWLSLLGFEIESCQFGCYAPPFEQQKWLQRWQFTEQAGRRWWKFSGAVYMLRAVKRVPGMRLITPCWQKKTLRNKALQPVVRKTPKEIHGQ